MGVSPMSSLQNAIDTVPPGAWAVGVSGGADSVALLELLRHRADLSLHVAHLDHETRAGDSAADADFVADLARQWKLPVTIARRSDIESAMEQLPKNLSARYRAARFALFRHVIAKHALSGVILAHHADDQAETIMQRLLRGAGVTGLRGMTPRASIGGMTVLRPMLGVRRDELRRVLIERGIAWREDRSNASPNQQRNRVRAVLMQKPELVDPMLKLAETCAVLAGWLRAHSPPVADRLDIRVLGDLPPPVARHVARRWLAARAGKAVDITPAAVERLLEMANDAATPARQHFPGGILVRRRGGTLSREE